MGEPVRVKVEKALKEMFDRISTEASAAVLASSDGLVVAYLTPPDVEPRIVAAQIAALRGMAERMMDRVGAGSFNRAILGGSNGDVVVVKGEELLLGLLLKKGANLGLVMLEAESSIKRLEEALRG